MKGNSDAGLGYKLDLKGKRDGDTEFDPDFGFKRKRDGDTEFDPDFGFKN